MIRTKKYKEHHQLPRQTLATLLLFGTLLQSCSTSYSECNVNPTTLIDEYPKHLSQEHRQHFETYVSPIIKTKLSPLSESEQVTILEKIFSRGLFIPKIFTENPPQQWNRCIETLLIDGRIAELPTLLQKNSTISFVKKLYQSQENLEEINHLLDFFSEKYKTPPTSEALNLAIDHIEKFSLPLQSYPFLAKKILESNPSEIVEQVHQTLIYQTFQPDQELTLEEIVDRIVQKAPNVSFVNDRTKILATYNSIKATFAGKSAYPAEISQKNISEWGVVEVKTWGTKIKNQEITPTDHEIIAVVFQAAKVRNKFPPRNTQILSIISLLNKPSTSGRLAQINTGEGKSLIVAMLAAIKALKGNKIDVITTSPELIIPEVNKQKPFFEMLSLTVDHNQDAKCEQYQKDIVYGTAGNFQGDILRTEFMKENIRGNRPFHVVIVDEVDSMLFDDRSTSTQLSSITPAAHHLDLLLGAVWNQVNQIRRHLMIMGSKIYFIEQDFIVSDGVNFKVKSRANPRELLHEVHDLQKFIQEGVEMNLRNFLRTLSTEEQKIYDSYVLLNEEYTAGCMKLASENCTEQEIEEKTRSLKEKLNSHTWLKSTNPILSIPKHLLDFARDQVPRWAENAISALFVHKKLVDYDVVGDKIIPIDRHNTGVLQRNMVWSDGLAQFLQIKEGLPITSESITTNFLSGPGFFKRYGPNIFGLTGTLGNDETRDFFKEIYNTDLVIIPPYKLRPVAGNETSIYICKEMPPIIAREESTWLEKIASTNLHHARCGQGVLIICENISKVFSVSSLLEKNYLKEKLFIYTGQEKFHKENIDSGEIIIATNIAGRGTDITTTPSVENAGGLHVSVTSLPSSNRVELQNIGRTARQGKKGTGQLIILNTEHPDIHSLKTLREKQENDSIASAKRDVRNIVFKDELFEKFCNFCDTIVFAGNEDEKIKKSLILHHLWQITKHAELTPEKINREFTNRTNEIIEQVYSVEKVELERAVNKHFDDLMAPHMVNLNAQDHQEIQNLIVSRKQQELANLYPIKRQAVENELRSENRRQQFHQTYYANTLNSFCDALNETYPREVVDCMRQERLYERKVTPLMRGANWDEYERMDIQERWGFWMKKHLDGRETLDKVAIEKHFENFCTEIKRDAEANTLIKNAYHYIRKGNAHKTYEYGNERSISVKQCYERAIALDPRNAANAHYFYANYLLSGDYDRENFALAIKNLERADLLIEAYSKPDIVSLNTLVGAESAGTALVKKLTQRLNILQKQQEYIRSALLNIREADAKEWEVEIKHTSLKDLFKDADENHDDVIVEAFINGLPTLYTAIPREPTNWLGILGCALLGIAQIVGGAILTISTAGMLGTGLISEGISDLCTAVKSCVDGGKFSWKDYFVTKAINLTISIVTSAWEAICSGTSKVVKLVKDTFTKKAGLAVAKNAIVNCGLRQGITTVAQIATRHTLGDEIQKMIEQKVEKTLTKTFANNHTMQRAIAADIKHTRNGLQNRIIACGLPLLNEPSSEICNFLTSVGRGVLSNQVRYVAEFFQIKAATSAVDDLLNYTERFANDLIKVVERDEMAEIQKWEKCTVDRSNTQQEDAERVIYQMQKGVYYNSEERGAPKLRHNYCQKSDVARIAEAFTYKIGEKIYGKLRAAIIDPSVSIGVNSLIDAANNDSKKIKEHLIAADEDYVEHDLREVFPEIFQKEKISTAEKVIKEKMRETVRQSTVASEQTSVPEIFIFPRVDLNYLAQSYNLRTQIEEKFERIREQRSSQSENASSQQKKSQGSREESSNTKPGHGGASFINKAMEDQGDKGEVFPTGTLLSDPLPKRDELPLFQETKEPIYNLSKILGKHLPSREIRIMRHLERDLGLRDLEIRNLTKQCEAHLAKPTEKRSLFTNLRTDEHIEISPKVREGTMHLLQLDREARGLKDRIDDLNAEIFTWQGFEIGGGNFSRKLKERNVLLEEFGACNKLRNQCRHEQYMAPLDTYFNDTKFYKEEEHSVAIAKNFFKSFTAESAKDIGTGLALLEKITNRETSVADVYAFLTNVPNMREMVWQQYDLFYNFGDEKKSVLITEALGRALAERYQIPLLKESLSENFSKAVEKVIAEEPSHYSEAMRKFHEEKQYRAFLEEERAFLQKTQSCINTIEAKMEAEGGTPAQLAELNGLYTDLNVTRRNLGMESVEVKNFGKRKDDPTTTIANHPPHIVEQVYYTKNGKLSHYEGKFRIAHEALKNPFHKEEYTAGHHVLYSDKRGNNDPAKHLVMYDYDHVNGEFIFYGLDVNGNKAKCIGYPTIGKGIRVDTLLKESFKGKKPRTRVSVEKAYITIGSEEVVVGKLLKGIDEKRSDILFEQDLIKRTYTLESKLGDGDKQLGAKRMKALGKKKCDAILNLAFNAGWGMPKTLALMRDLADDPNSINNPEWIKGLQYNIAEVCTADGAFQKGILLRRLENIEDILGKRPSDEELRVLSKELTKTLKNRTKKPDFSIGITFSEAKNKYEFEIKPKEDKK